MIVRGGTGFRRAITLFFLKNWFAIAIVLAIEVTLVYVPKIDFVSSVFSTGAVAMLATVVGIFLGFRFNEAYSRWWEARGLWGQMVNSRASVRPMLSGAR